MKKNNLFKKNMFLLAFIVLLSFSACDKDFLEEWPQTELNEGVFWRNEQDAIRGLNGVYWKREVSPAANWGPYNASIIYWSEWTDEGTCIRTGAPSHWPIEGIYSSTQQVHRFWQDCWIKIASTNYFLDNIDRVEMDENKKAEITAEVKFLRANWYFWLSQLYGGVPLLKTTSSFDEANSISRNTKAEIVTFVFEELTEAVEYLPIKRPSSEKGRVEKGTALAVKGRLLMAEKRWTEAATTYKQIMDLNRYKIVPTFEECFEDEGDFNDETIFAVPYVQDINGTYTYFSSGPVQTGGSNHIQFFQSFVDKFPMIDGKTIEESPLFNPDNPFENRDPRLYRTVAISGITEYYGKLFQGHPDSISRIGQFGPHCTGYGSNKFIDHTLEGNNRAYGADTRLIRYAEVLLSRLESELEAGTSITQNLLDETINKVRKREAVNIGSVTTTNTNELREILRNERCIELAAEGGIRYWDLLRWEIAHEVLTSRFYGLKLTDNPQEYTGKYPINDKGHLFVEEREFKDHFYLWPIPLVDTDINKNLEQNPGYN